MLADRTYIASQVIECNEEEYTNETEEDTIKEDENWNTDVSTVLIIDLSFCDLFYIHLL